MPLEEVTVCNTGISLLLSTSVWVLVLCMYSFNSRLRLRLRSLNPFVRSGRPDQSILKWNAQVLRTGSDQNGSAHGSEPLSSPTPVDQKRGNLESCGEKMYVLPFKLARTSSFRLGRTDKLESDLRIQRKACKF